MPIWCSVLIAAVCSICVHTAFLFHFVVNKVVDYHGDQSDRRQNDGEIRPRHGCRKAVLPVILYLQHTGHNRIGGGGKGVDDGEDQIGKDHRADVGQDDLPEVFPGGCPLDLCRLSCGGRNVLQGCQEDQNLDAGAPYKAEHIGGQGLDLGGQILADAVDAKEGQQFLYKIRLEHGGKLGCIAVAVGFQVAVDDIVHRAGGNDDRQEEHGSCKGSSPELLVEDHGDEQGEYDDEGRSLEGFLQHLHQQLPVVGVAHKGVFVVADARPGGNRAAGFRGNVLERIDQRGNQRNEEPLDGTHDPDGNKAVAVQALAAFVWDLHQDRSPPSST